jgi:hypothetical protein
MPVAGGRQIEPFGTQTEVIVGVVLGGGGGGGAAVVKVTAVVFDTLLTVAVTVAVPAAEELSLTVATPAVVVRIVVFVPVSANVPAVVVNCTAVPSVTGLPFSVTVAVTVTVELTCTELLGVTVRMIVAFVGGVTPPLGGVVDVDGGAVGDDSLLQPAMASTSIPATRIVRMRSVVVFM